MGLKRGSNVPLFDSFICEQCEDHLEPRLWLILTTLELCTRDSFSVWVSIINGLRSRDANSSAYKSTKEVQLVEATHTMKNKHTWLLIHKIYYWKYCKRNVNDSTWKSRIDSDEARSNRSAVTIMAVWKSSLLGITHYTNHHWQRGQGVSLTKMPMKYSSGRSFQTDSVIVYSAESESAELRQAYFPKATGIISSLVWYSSRKTSLLLSNTHLTSGSSSPRWHFNLAGYCSSFPLEALQCHPTTIPSQV